MCGIIGYIGEKPAASILIEGLKRLEYRGYDSAGIATLERTLEQRKVVGKVSGLEPFSAMHGTLGVGHTRWATHGAPSERNAHPHRSGGVALVHNGIVENHDSLREELRGEGFSFESDTDTEVLPHLIVRALRKGANSLEDALSAALRGVEGAYAVAIVSEDHPDRLVAACHSSPLVIGIGERELYLASDELALAGKVSAIVHVRDGEVVTLKRNGHYSFHGIPLGDIEARREKPAMGAAHATKGGYAHYMLKEIYEQPQAMRNVVAGRVREGHGVVFGGLTRDIESRLAEVRRVVLAGCGTSLFAAMAARDTFERIAGVMCDAEQAAEFSYRDPQLAWSDALIGISQSGETADTLRAVELARERHALVLGLTNRVGSTLARRTKVGIYLHAGPEIAVASTKAFTAQVAALTLLAVRIAELRQRDVPEALRRQLLRLPRLVERSLDYKDEMHRLARQFAYAPRLIVIGRGSGVALAQEAALKVREVSYMDAHGLSAAELKHGTLALIEKGVPVVALLPQGHLRAKMLSNIEEVRSRGGEVVILEAPDGLHESLVPIVMAPPLQLLAYYLGVERGVDVDQPRNLAKSVTVE